MNTKKKRKEKHTKTKKQKEINFLFFHWENEMLSFVLEIQIIETAQNAYQNT